LFILKSIIKAQILKITCLLGCTKLKLILQYNKDASSNKTKNPTVYTVGFLFVLQGSRNN